MVSSTYFRMAMISRYFSRSSFLLTFLPFHYYTRCQYIVGSIHPLFHQSASFCSHMSLPTVSQELYQVSFRSMATKVLHGFVSETHSHIAITVPVYRLHFCPLACTTTRDSHRSKTETNPDSVIRTVSHGHHHFIHSRQETQKRPMQRRSSLFFVASGSIR